MPLSDQQIIQRLRARAYARKPAHVTPDTALRLAAALNAVIADDRVRVRPKRAAEPELPFRVEAYSLAGDKLEEVVTLTKIHAVAIAAFRAAVEHYPISRLRLRQGAHVMMDSADATER